MCFGDGQVRKCRFTEDLENFEEIMSTQFDHRGVRMATDDLERTFGKILKNFKKLIFKIFAKSI